VGLKVYDAGVCFGLGQPVKTGYRIGKQKKVFYLAYEQLLWP